MAVDREGRARECASAERKHVYALVAVLQALKVTLEHADVSHQMVREQDRLRTLQMRIPRDNRIEISLRFLKQGFLQLDQQAHELHHTLAQVEMHIRCHLIVAAAARVQLAADRTDQVDQGFLDIHMNIFILNRVLQLAAANHALHLQQAVFDFLHVFRRQDTAFAQHRHMRQAAFDIFLS
ncbi:hypothetical protein D3C85_1082750 [compost metagenome]